MLKYYPDADILELGGSIVNEEWLHNDVMVGYGEGGRVVRVEAHNAPRKGLLK